MPGDLNWGKQLQGVTRFYNDVNARTTDVAYPCPIVFADQVKEWAVEAPTVRARDKHFQLIDDCISRNLPAVPYSSDDHRPCRSPENF